MAGGLIRRVERGLDLTSPMRGSVRGAAGEVVLRGTPLGRRVRRAAATFVGAFGRVGEGTLPIVFLPGIGTSPDAYVLLTYFMRAAGFHFHVVDTRWASTASVRSDAQLAARTAVWAMREVGADSYVLSGYSRGGLGMETLRLERPEDFVHVAAMVFVDSPIYQPPNGAQVPPALRLLAGVSRHVTSGGRELVRTDLWQRLVATREEGLRAAHATRSDFRAIAIQARPDVVPHAMSMLPVIDGVTDNVRARPASAGHMIGMGSVPEFDQQLALLYAGLPANDARLNQRDRSRAADRAVQRV